MKSKVIIPIKLIKIEDDGFHLIIKIKINNKVAHLLVDSGASRTVFDINKKQKLIKEQKLIKNKSLATGLGTDNMISHSSIIKKISFNNHFISNYQGYFIDLSLVNSTYQKIKLKPIDGVIGNDILKKYNAIIDYQRLELRLLF
jgi:hypothetical protein